MKKAYLPKDLNGILNIFREYKKELREKYRVKEIRVFGFWVRKEQRRLKSSGSQKRRLKR
jgi:predicted nucleotidyltransferase